MKRRQMHLVAFLKTGPTFHHHGAWRHPMAPLDDILRPERYEHVARVLEAACFDACFFEDFAGIFETYGGDFTTMLGKGGQINLLDPLMVLPFMARATSRLGLGITLSTSFYHPFQLARMLSSLDHLSGGRVAWNVVTSANDKEAQNFGLERIGDRDTRYGRAEETVEACMKLWQSWEADALILDKVNGRFADPTKVHATNYAGRYVKTRGPLPTPRSPQGHPVIMQAGSSPRGRAFAARFAEMIFTFQFQKSDMQAFRQDMHARMAAHGRDPRHCAILPSLDIILGETRAMAEEKRALLDSLVDPELALAITSCHIGIDLKGMPLDKPLAVLAEDVQVRGSFDILMQGMQAEKGLTLREAAQRYGTSCMAPQLCGTAQDVADQMQDLFDSEACDGFVVTPTTFPGMFEDFARALTPELQRRGLLRTAYAGKTLRETLRD
ncbi:FMN-dependent oxidoreductase, nitrilotriacetate monooxygenase family [Arboricoccus pini]|uniref:FMN-dependent oxidoreductase, nitrilotriacetate monooxygenase family n=1 Tax=Arboricoccus pini TaxID=1963835 RepID=A0A212RG56_9PROT|nr:LLM class flavin-dependent oxidoreductase [Arboricoccus pini]SNB71356.1 FMN-dependent oxidoreductase, nitrilotriacetate monooxygenase family [Arboricoccus pini]